MYTQIGNCISITKIFMISIGLYSAENFIKNDRKMSQNENFNKKN